MIDKVSPNKCCLCRACFEICPAGAIDFTVSENGFNYPAIDSVKCINCQKCDRVCPEINDTFNVEQGFPVVYAGHSIDAKSEQIVHQAVCFLKLLRK